MKLYSVHIEWTGWEDVFVLASTDEEARTLAMEEADSSNVDFEVEVRASKAPIPPHEATLDNYLISEDFSTVRDWWDARELTEAEQAAKSRAELELLGQERLPLDL
jgi:hypothetical protein